MWLGFRLLVPVVRFFADLPFAVVPFPRPYTAVLVAGGLLVLVLTHWDRVRDRSIALARRRLGRLAVATLAVVGAVVWSAALRPARVLEVTFLDVGQGDSTFTRLPDGETLLTDGGSWTPTFGLGERVVVPYLLSRGLRAIDWVVATHPDVDHAGGLPMVLHSLSVGHLLGLSPAPLDVGPDRRLREAVLDTGVAAEYGAGRVLVDKEVRGIPLRVEVIYPRSAEDVVLTDANANVDSLVVLLTYGSVRLLLPGDIESDVEAFLVERQKRGELDLRADVLKAPHHGSDSSSSERFLEAVRPQITVISAGDHELYGHPADEVVARYRELGAQIYRTDRPGAIRLRSDGERCWVRAVRR